MFCKGQVVRCIAGREKNRYYVVVDVQENAVWIADGRRRKLAKPKSKNPKHLRTTYTIWNVEEFYSDRSLRQKLEPMNQSLMQGFYTKGVNEHV